MPAIIRNVPKTMTNPLQATMSIHLVDLVVLPAVQLSYSHMQPMGWKDMRVPRRAPISDTSPPKTGIALAMI